MNTKLNVLSGRATGRVRRMGGTCGLLILALILSAGCGRSDAQPQNLDLPQIRTPRPTFTPSALPANALPGSDAAAGAAQGADDTSNALSMAAARGEPEPFGATAVINTPLVNVRSGPGIEFDVVNIVERGQEFDILARNDFGDWWYVCCVANQPVWVFDQLVDTLGPVDDAPVADAAGTIAAPAREPQSVPVAQPPAQSPGAIGGSFRLSVQEQFPETQFVRIYLFITDGNQGIGGYGLRVSRDGIPLPVNELSFGGQPGFTWPFQDARQRSQNLKVEFPGISAAGTWQVEPVDAAGNGVGQAATFTLGDNDSRQELYLRYERQ